MTLTRLPETINSVATYLLIAYQRHPKFILGAGDTPTTNPPSIEQLRITLYYVEALLALGVDPDEPEIAQTLPWFATRVPNAELQAVDVLRLEYLLRLHPSNPSIQRRLELLVRQRLPNGLFTIPENQRYGNPIRDTLWALRILILARQQKVLDGRMTDDELVDLIQRAIDGGVTDSDAVHALQLHYALCGGLEEAHKTELRNLLKHAEGHGYLWGVAPYQWQAWAEAIVQALQESRLNATNLRTYTPYFRDAILSTCNVVEHLAALPGSPKLRAAMERSVTLWWSRFCGDDNVPGNVKEVFSLEPDFLAVLCRMVISMRAFVGQPLGPASWVEIGRRGASMWLKHEEWPKDNVVEALRNWLVIQMPEESTPLHLGLSDANVIRINPGVYNPIDRSANLLHHSLIVKYGPREEIEKERTNYSQIPRNIQELFVKIPKESHVNEQGVAFVIMEDLRDYQTLYEVYRDLLREQSTNLPGQLASLLDRIHQASPDRYSNPNHLRDIYLLSMMEHISRVFNHLERNRLLLADPDHLHDTQAEIMDLIAEVMEKRAKIASFPLAFSHGDLHSRNIMIQVNPETSQVETDKPLVFKLIDLENVNPNGDAAYDAGELSVDLDLMRDRDLNEIEYDEQPALELSKLKDYLENRYIEQARQRGDETFALRMELGKARALLRVAKGLSKRSAFELDGQNYPRATTMAQESLDHTETATNYLRLVVRRIDALA
jgi:thiamine kinase-like enzyme